ncbi:MAG: transposase, partial [bacterium]|nr:transposase [bacterium]
KSLRIMAALLIITRLRGLSDREAVIQVKENRYIQYFCNAADEGQQTFPHPSSLCVFRKRLGEVGVSVIECEVFETLRRAGVISGDDALIDSTVMESDIIYPNDVRLIYKAFGKMRAFAASLDIPLRQCDKELKRLWREFCLDKKGNRAAWPAVFNEMFVPALKIFEEKVRSPRISGRQKEKAAKLPDLPDILEKQTLRKPDGE